MHETVPRNLSAGARPFPRDPTSDCGIFLPVVRSLLGRGEDLPQVTSEEREIKLSLEKMRMKMHVDILCQLL